MKEGGSMLKMSIEMNTQKILSERKHNLSNIYHTIDSIFLQTGLIKNPTNNKHLMYHGTNHPKDFGRFGKIFNFLKKQTWFIENVSSWILYDNEYAETPDEFYAEDLLRDYHSK